MTKENHNKLNFSTQSERIKNGIKKLENITEKVESMQMWKTGYTKEKQVEDRKTRECMMCYKPFESIWNGNRICSVCKATDDWQYGNDYSVSR